MAVVGALTQDIEIRINGAREANAELGALNKNLDAGGRAAGNADAGLRKAETAATKARGAWATFSRTTSQLSEGIGKVTFAAQGLTTLVGGGMVGAIGGAALALAALIDELSDADDATRVWTEETAKAKSGLSDIKAPLDAGRHREALAVLAELDPNTRNVDLRIECLLVEAGIRDDLGQRAEALQRRLADDRAT